MSLGNAMLLVGSNISKSVDTKDLILDQFCSRSNELNSILFHKAKSILIMMVIIALNSTSLKIYLVTLRIALKGLGPISY
jgi:hypothetical protein